MKTSFQRPLLHLGIIFALCLPFVNLSYAQNCGTLESDIRFAGLDWASARFHSAIARYILELGFSCTTEVVSGSTTPLIKSLTLGELEVMMEVWKNNAPDIYVEALKQANVLELSLIMEGVQAFFVPRYMVEGDLERGIQAVAPNLRSVADLNGYAELFQDPLEPDKGRFYNCVVGWNCERLNTLKYYAYKLDKAFTNYRSESLVELEKAVEAAYRKGEPILTYYWGPTWILGNFDMLMLEEPAYDEAAWQAMRAAAQAEEFASATKAVAYPRSLVTVAVSKRMAEQAPKGVIDFLSHYQMDQSIVSTYLAVIRNEVLEPEEVALIFLRDMPELWTTWLPKDIATKIQDSLVYSPE